MAGGTVTLTEMLPIQKQVKVVVGWKGKRFNLHLCQEGYNLGDFLGIMNDWDGEILSIGYTGPENFTEDLINKINNPGYKEHNFEYCELPEGFASRILEKNQGLLVSVIDRDD